MISITPSNVFDNMEIMAIHTWKGDTEALKFTSPDVDSQ